MTRDEKIDFLSRAIDHAWERPIPKHIRYRLARELVDKVEAEVDGVPDYDDFPIAWG